MAGAEMVALATGGQRIVIYCTERHSYGPTQLLGWVYMAMVGALAPGIAPKIARAEQRHQLRTSHDALACSHSSTRYWFGSHAWTASNHANLVHFTRITVTS